MEKNHRKITKKGYETTKNPLEITSLYTSKVPKFVYIGHQKLSTQKTIKNHLKLSIIILKTPKKPHKSSFFIPSSQDFTS